MRLYTEAEARALLPEVIPVLARLHTAFVGLRALRAAVSAQARGASGDGSLLADPWEQPGSENRAREMAAELQAAAAQLAAWGIGLKDPDRGLIDFYHKREGEVVFLCYLIGEPDIQYWHTLEGGFAGRERL